jgi:hypothetical protein
MREYVIPEKKIPMDLWLKIFGIWITEGCTVKTKRRNYLIEITQYNKKRLKKYCSWLKQAGFNAYITSNGRNVELSNKQLWTYLKQFNKAKDKFIPQEIKQLSKRQLEILYEIMMEGDGSGGIIYATASKKLADDFQEILLKIGYAGTIQKRKSGFGKEINIITISKDRLTPRANRGKEKRKWINYNGKVYCITVPNPLVYVRRNGKVCWCGNSWFKYGIIQIDTTYFKTASPSQRLTPNSATNKLESGSKKAALNSAATAIFSVWVRKSSVAAGGADYNGNQPRLILKRNDAAGITADTVLATMTAGLDTWQQLTGTTPVVTDDAVLEVVVDCDGVAGFVNADDWEVT